jgi:Leucine-rich repeat (LRR) protein
LDLSSNSLEGSVPSSISSLTNLQIFDVSNNFFNVSLIPDLGKITTLTELRATFSQNGGTFPVELGTLTNLKVLRINQNNISSTLPTDIGNLVALGKYTLDGPVSLEFSTRC